MNAFKMEPTFQQPTRHQLDTFHKISFKRSRYQQEKTRWCVKSFLRFTIVFHFFLILPVQFIHVFPPLSTWYVSRLFFLRPNRPSSCVFCSFAKKICFVGSLPLCLVVSLARYFLFSRLPFAANN